MSYCEKCGAGIIPGDLFCSGCGAPVREETEPVRSYEEERRDTREDERRRREEENRRIREEERREREDADRRRREEERKEREEIAKKTREESERRQYDPDYGKGRAKTERRGTDRSTKHMASGDLWSWLKKDAKRQKFYTEDVSDMTAETFVAKVNDKLKENEVPATISKKSIEWDRSNIYQDIYYVSPKTTSVNPLTCLVQFNHVGKFTFVEEKTFITPPDLPEVPEKPWEVDPARMNMIMRMIGLGAILILAGIFLMMLMGPLALILLFAGIISAGIGGYMYMQLKSIKEHNAKVAQQVAAWNQAWKDWQDSIFVYSFQEDINGQLSRIFDSAFECIKQVSEAEFKNVLSTEVDEAVKRNELEALIARRKEEYR